MKHQKPAKHFEDAVIYKVVSIKTTDILSVAVSMFAAVAAYTVGVEKWRSLQGFFLGLALWLVQRRKNNTEQIKKQERIDLRSCSFMLCVLLNTFSAGPRQSLPKIRRRCPCDPAGYCR